MTSSAALWALADHWRFMAEISATLCAEMTLAGAGDLPAHFAAMWEIRDARHRMVVDSLMRPAQPVNVARELRGVVRATDADVAAIGEVA